jgi:hypothetical protein
MLLYPFESHSLVQQPRIEIPVSSHLLTCQEPVRANAIVEIDHNDVVARVCYDCRSVVICIGILCVATTCDVDPYRKFRIGGRRSGTPDINEEAIFRLG